MNVLTWSAPKNRMDPSPRQMAPLIVVGAPTTDHSNPLRPFPQSPTDQQSITRALLTPLFPKFLPPAGPFLRVRNFVPIQKRNSKLPARGRPVRVCGAQLIFSDAATTICLSLLCLILTTRWFCLRHTREWVGGGALRRMQDV